jgi:hypothetical protein
MIHLTDVKSLLLTHASQPGRRAHLSAASGLVQAGSWLYVVADDELQLAQFPVTGNDRGQLHRCFPGLLPVDYEARKAEKPDVEVLTLLPNFTHTHHSTLLALGSGSKKHRNRSALIPLYSSGDMAGPATILELEFFYEFLKQEIGKLNIEGAAIVEERLLLFQRGNKKNKLNASLEISLADFYRVLAQPHKHFQPRLEIKPYDLGQIDQVPLCFTDATSLADGRIVFTASAENTSDAYVDGACMGSAIGLLDADGELVLLESIDKKIKLEGVEAHLHDKTIELLLVTDADDAEQPAQLYAAQMKNPG